MTDLNVNLLERTVEWAIESHNRDVRAHAVTLDERKMRWYQGMWISPTTSGAAPEGGNECGTACCIAGYIIAQDGIKAGIDPADAMALDNWFFYGEGTVSYGTYAANRLGIDRNEAEDLFHGENSIWRVKEIAEEIAHDHGYTLSLPTIITDPND